MGLSLEEKLTEMKECVKSESIYRPDIAMIPLSVTIEFCKEALKKQRELCADISTTYFSRAYAITNRILNTPEPTWEDKNGI
uniref:Uncharacterized protein n=1 Tax=viral metagenome TaxID=1070528 RepID=A0A6H1ZU46_9ZZZZ